MANTIRIRRRQSNGAAGAPTDLVAAELAFNEADNTLYYGAGNLGGQAMTALSIAGPGAFLPLTGGTLTGALLLSGDPSDPLASATKQYVDGKAGVVAVADTAPGSPRNGTMWWDSIGTQLYLYFNDGTSSQWVSTNNQIATASDARLKRNITDIDRTTAVNWLRASRPVIFDRLQYPNGTTSQHAGGFLAQEQISIGMGEFVGKAPCQGLEAAQFDEVTCPANVQLTLPEGYQIALLTKALQVAYDQIEALSAKITALEARL